MLKFRQNTWLINHDTNQMIAKLDIYLVLRSTFYETRVNINCIFADSFRILTELFNFLPKLKIFIAELRLQELLKWSWSTWKEEMNFKYCGMISSVCRRLLVEIDFANKLLKIIKFSEFVLNVFVLTTCQLKMRLKIKFTFIL